MPSAMGNATFAEIALISMETGSPILIDVAAKIEDRSCTSGLGFILMLPQDKILERHKLLDEIKYYLEVKLSEFYDI